MTNRTRGSLYVISGPSGAGKGTILGKVLAQNPQMWFSVSATTRKPRPGEKDGEDYFFLTPQEFDSYVHSDGFLEWAHVFNERYGTLRHPVESRLDQGIDVILDIDVQGAMQVQQNAPYAQFIFIEPPSIDELERRLRNRQTETEEQIATRLSCAKNEMAHKSRYNYTVINDNLDDAVKQVSDIIHNR